MNEGRAAALRRRVVRKNKLAVVLDRTALCRQRRETIAQPRPPLHALNDARLQFASVEEAVIVADGRRFDAAEQHRRVNFDSRIAGSLLTDNALEPVVLDQVLSKHRAGGVARPAATGAPGMFAAGHAPARTSLGSGTRVTG